MQNIAFFEEHVKENFITNVMGRSLTGGNLQPKRNLMVFAKVSSSFSNGVPDLDASLDLRFWSNVKASNPQ